MEVDRTKKKVTRSARLDIKLKPQSQGEILLTKRDWELFLALLESDARPNRALRMAMKRFKRAQALGLLDTGPL